jgi:GH15 family glucan-1,4-alpha-glucosidase
MAHLEHRGDSALIEQDLVGRNGGVHRYLDDTFCGGGEWILLTTLLGEYRPAIGNHDGAERCRAFAMAQAGTAGRLPEQSSAATLAPSRIQEWVDLWGPVARPLLWSRAGCLGLAASLQGEGSARG